MQPKKALVVDDSALIHEVFKLILPHSTLLAASDGREALRRLADHPDVDLVFLDINMPRMNGFELLARIKSDPALAGIPVIVISIEGSEEDILRGLRAGAVAYVKKPFGNETVRALVRGVTVHRPDAVAAAR